MANRPAVLVVDDNLAVDSPESETVYDRAAFMEDYAGTGMDFHFCSGFDAAHGQYTVEAATQCIGNMQRAPAVILLDVRFGSIELLGLEILRSLCKRHPSVPVVMMTSAAKQELWARCVELGAVDYLVKPIQADILRQTVNRYAEPDPGVWLIGQANSFLTAVDQVARAAEGGTSSVLLLGSSGTGKELFSRFLHRHGPRRDKALQVIHIPGIPANLVEAELFGYAKGAFTGASREEMGRIRRADGGILFLDEVADLTLSAQASLLRVLETREVTRLGDGRTFKADFQVVAATNVNLAQRVKDNLFRLDLYNRLAGTVVHLPTLQERMDDVGLLIRHLLRRAYLDRGIDLPFAELPRGIEDELGSRVWSGNIRELWNYTQRVLDSARRRAPTRQDFLSALLRQENPEQPINVLAAAKSKPFDLECLPIDTVRAATAFLEHLALRELALLRSALELTRDPATGLQNRARAAALLKGTARASTNDFNRWVDKVASRLTDETIRLVRLHYPELFSTHQEVSSRVGALE